LRREPPIEEVYGIIKGKFFQLFKLFPKKNRNLSMFSRHPLVYQKHGSKINSSNKKQEKMKRKLHFPLAKTVKIYQKSSFEVKNTFQLSDTFFK
jgi:hypothetical protein